MKELKLHFLDCDYKTIEEYKNAVEIAANEKFTYEDLFLSMIEYCQSVNSFISYHNLNQLMDEYLYELEAQENEHPLYS